MASIQYIDQTHELARRAGPGDDNGVGRRFKLGSPQEAFMRSVLPVLVVAAVLGAGLVSGLLFAFSNFVMRALLQLPAEFGMQAMQRINVAIINPLFLLVFLGTALLCLLIGAMGVSMLPAAGAWCLAAGALAYLIGPFGVTLLFNVPMNNRLASVAPERAAADWPRYAASWLRWNHVRTLLGAVATALLAFGLPASLAVQP